MTKIEEKTEGSTLSVVVGNMRQRGGGRSLRLVLMTDDEEGVCPPQHVVLNNSVSQ